MLKESFDPKRLKVNLQSIPNPEDLYFFVLELANSKAKTMEIAWDRSDGMAHFQLLLTAKLGVDVFIWQLKSGKEPNVKLLWEQNTKDIKFIHNLIVKSCGTLKVTSNKISKEISAITEPDKDFSQLSTNQHKAFSSKETKPDSISGTTAFISLIDLILNIYKAKNTGKLTVYDEANQFDTYFIGGVLTHCQYEESTGLSVFYNLLETNDCKFEFEFNSIIRNRSINIEMEDLFNNCTELINESSYLKDIGINPNSVLNQVNQKLSKSEFRTIFNHLSKDNLTNFEQLYKHFDGNLTIAEIVQSLNLPKSTWVPSVSRLIKHGLITQIIPSVDKPETPAKIKPLDQSLIKSVMMILKRADTQIYSYPAFMFFLEQEYLRSQRANCPFSVILLSFYQKQNNDLFHLQGKALEELLKRIEVGIRRTDYLTHYESSDFALVLPNTHTHGAKILVNRLINKLLIYPLTNSVNSLNLVIACGIVCAPYDIKDIHLILPALETARDYALQNGSRVISYQDIIDRI